MEIGFLEPLGNDFHLAADSLCIDAGDPADTTVDQRGAPVVGGVHDIGAYEYLAAGSPSPDTTPPSAPQNLNVI